MINLVKACKTFIWLQEPVIYSLQTQPVTLDFDDSFGHLRNQCSPLGGWVSTTSTYSSNNSHHRFSMTADSYQWQPIKAKMGN